MKPPAVLAPRCSDVADEQQVAPTQAIATLPKLGDEGVELIIGDADHVVCGGI
jgi:hypothetical protein